MKKTQKSAKERVMRKLRVIGALQIAAAKAESANSAKKASVQPPIAVISTSMPPTEIPTSAASGLRNHPEGLLTTIDLESSLPNGFQSKVLRNSSSVYWRTWAASKCNWKCNKENFCLDGQQSGQRIKLTFCRRSTSINCICFWNPSNSCSICLSFRFTCFWCSSFRVRNSSRKACAKKQKNGHWCYFISLLLLTATFSSNFCRSTFNLVICSSCLINLTPSERDEESRCFNSRSCRSQMVRNILVSLMASLIFRLLDSISALTFSSYLSFKANWVCTPSLSLVNFLTSSVNRLFSRFWN